MGADFGIRLHAPIRRARRQWRGIDVDVARIPTFDAGGRFLDIRRTYAASPSSSPLSSALFRACRCGLAAVCLLGPQKRQKPAGYVQAGFF